MSSDSQSKEEQSRELPAEQDAQPVSTDQKKQRLEPASLDETNTTVVDETSDALGTAASHAEEVPASSSDSDSPALPGEASAPEPAERLATGGSGEAQSIGATITSQAQSIHDAARHAAILADSEELKSKLKRPTDKAIQAAASVMQNLEAAEEKDFDAWLDELDAKLAAASALLDKAAEEKEAMHRVEAEIAAAQQMAAERVAKERLEHLVAPEKTEKPGEKTESKTHKNRPIGERKERRKLPRDTRETAEPKKLLPSAPDSVPQAEKKQPSDQSRNKEERSQAQKGQTIQDETEDLKKGANQEKIQSPSTESASAKKDENPGDSSSSSSSSGTGSGNGSISTAGDTVQKNVQRQNKTARSSPQPTKSEPQAVTRRKPSAGPGSDSEAANAPPIVPTCVPVSTTGAPTYDPEIADEYVKLRRLALDDRFWSMTKLMAAFAKEKARSKWLPDKKVPTSVRKRDLAIRFREALVELGPTFIKLGQFLSVRRDLLEAEMADELATLQDKVPPFSADQAIKTIAQELGQEPDKLFLEFDNTPIASASIGQVHRARLHDGREVVVKVQRPDLASKFYQDLGYMRALIRWGRRIKPDGDWDGWLALSDEFGRSLFSEIDYLQEGKNADRMRINLRDSGSIRIPRVIWKYTGRHVLAFEYCPGIKIDRISELKERNFDLIEIGNQLVYAYLEQVLIHGYFHADPHAGNLAIDDEGRIIMYDFGMVGEISEAQRLAIAGCVTSVIDKQGEDVAQYLVELGVLKAEANKAPVVRTLTPFIDYYSGRSVRDLDFSHLERDIDQIALERALKLPANLAYLLRAGSSVEGIARTLQPEFSFVEAAKPFIERWLLSRPTAFGALLKIFLKYSAEAYRTSAERLTSGSGLFGFGKRKEKSGQEIPRAQPTRSAAQEAANKGIGARPSGSDKTPPRVTSLPTQSTATSVTPLSLPDSEPEDVPATTVDSATQALERDCQNQQRQIYLLETRLGKSVRLQMIVGWSAAGALVFSSLFLIASFLADYRSYAHLFLIGNGVMGAIILWHLVEAALLGNEIQGKR